MKILNFLKKFWFVPAIIMLYFILAGLNWLPSGINIFKKQKLLIDDTPVIVKEIREIGELTTSEFYGEIYADLNELYDKMIVQFKDSIALNPEPFYEKYPGFESYISKEKEFRLKEIEFNAEKERYDNFLNDHIEKLKVIEENKKSLNTEIAAKGNDEKERKSLLAKIDELKQNMEAENNRFADAKKRYADAQNNFNRKQEDFWQTKKSRNLVYIGRGWVKAGIDLSQMNQNDILIDDGDSATMQIIIPDPVILDADINPWFINTNEKKVKGFEIFIFKTGSFLAKDNFTDFEVTGLKHLCKIKLQQEAIDKGLLKNAKSSAIHTIENFFGILGFQKVEVLFKSSTIVETTTE